MIATWTKLRVFLDAWARLSHARTVVIAQLLIVFTLAWTVPAHARQIALLIGVGELAAKAVGLVSLEGPQHDVAAMRDALVTRWNFRAEDVRTLVNRQATRAAILRELLALEQRSQPGDQVFIYFSGHGTSGYDARTGLQGYLANTGAWVPVDYPFDSDAPVRRDALIIGRDDLRPILSRLDRGGRFIFVAVDACYSGASFRGKASDDRLMRYINVRLSSDPSPVDPLAANPHAGARSREPFPYRNVFFMSASADNEPAREISIKHIRSGKYVTLDGRPHGIFTDALLRVLTGEVSADANGDGHIAFVELHEVVARIMQKQQADHTPQRLPEPEEDREHLAYRAVFSEASMTAPASPALVRGEPLVVRIGDSLESWRDDIVRRPNLRIATDDRAYDVELAKRGNDIIALSPAEDQIRKDHASNTAGWLGMLDALAEAKALDALARARRADTLNFVIEPGRFGGTLCADQHDARFTLQPRVRTFGFIVHVDPGGKYQMLYVGPSDERHSTAWTSVVAPYGVDQLFAFATDIQPPWIVRMRVKGNRILDEEDRRTFKQWLEMPTTPYAYAHGEFRTVAREHPGCVALRGAGN